MIFREYPTSIKVELFKSSTAYVNRFDTFTASEQKRLYNSALVNMIYRWIFSKLKTIKIETKKTTNEKSIYTSPTW